jgi:hypothetical protein
VSSLPKVTYSGGKLGIYAFYRNYFELVKPIFFSLHDGYPTYACPHKIQGTGVGFDPRNFDNDVFNEVLPLSIKGCLNFR